MNKKNTEKLKALIPNNDDFNRAMKSVEIFTGYPSPEENNYALNALVAFALDNEFKEQTLEKLDLCNLPEEALRIIFREFYKEFTKKNGMNCFTPNISAKEKENLINLQKLSQAIYPMKDHNAISAWLFAKLRWYICNSATEQIERTLFLLISEKENFRFGGLKSLGVKHPETADKLMPLTARIGQLMGAMYEKHCLHEEFSEESAQSTNTLTGEAFNEALAKKGMSMEDYLAQAEASSQENTPIIEETPEPNGTPEPQENSEAEVETEAEANTSRQLEEEIAKKILYNIQEALSKALPDFEVTLTFKRK